MKKRKENKTKVLVRKLKRADARILDKFYQIRINLISLRHEIERTSVRGWANFIQKVQDLEDAIQDLLSFIIENEECFKELEFCEKSVTVLGFYGIKAYLKGTAEAKDVEGVKFLLDLSEGWLDFLEDLLLPPELTFPTPEEKEIED